MLSLRSFLQREDLNDIPRYWPQAQAFVLPVVEYTAREVRSGLLFWAFAQRCSAAASSVFAARIQKHLERCGISLRDLVWQTDNGSEFIGGHDRRGHPTGFPTLYAAGGMGTCWLSPLLARNISDSS